MGSNRSAMSPQLLFFTLAAVCTVALYGIIYFATSLNPYIVWLVALGLTTFFLLGFDKLQAKRQGLRVPEIVLHILTLLGGVIGAWLGRLFFHHKSNVRRHRSFLVVPIVGSLIHAGLAIYWFLL